MRLAANAHRCMSARTPAKSCSIWTTHWSEGRVKGGDWGISPSADGAHCVRCASYERGSMLDVTTAGSCAASCLSVQHFHEHERQPAACSGIGWSPVHMMESSARDAANCAECISLSVHYAATLLDMLSSRGMAPDTAQVLLGSGGRPRSKIWLPIHRQRPVDSKLLQVPLDLSVHHFNKSGEVSGAMRRFWVSMHQHDALTSHA